MSKFSNLSSLKLLRSIDLLSRLTILQLSQIADSLAQIPYSDGQTLADKDEVPLGLYIIQKGNVRITVDKEWTKSSNICSLMSDITMQDGDDTQVNQKVVLEKAEGSYFGEWALLGEHISSVTAVAVGDVVCAVLTKEKFDSVVGPLAKLSQDAQEPEDHSLGVPNKSFENLNPSDLGNLKLIDLEWQRCVYSNECSEIGLVLLRNSETVLSLKRFSKHKIRNLRKEAQVLKEKNLMKSISHSVCVPEVLCTCTDQTYAGLLLETTVACPIVSVLNNPFDEVSAQYIAASVVYALEDLHKNRVLYRGISPDVLMLDQTGHLQLVDFRFGKKLSDERTFTICGMADSLAPEIVNGNGHGFPADWWALGVLVYFMLVGEMPFGSWRESELDTYAKIAKGQVNLPDTLSDEAGDLITKLLEIDESSRLGSQGADSVKKHPWFKGIDWKGFRNNTVPVPDEILSRIRQHLVVHSEDARTCQISPPQNVEELDTEEWLQDW